MREAHQNFMETKITNNRSNSHELKKLNYKLCRSKCFFTPNFNNREKTDLEINSNP